jgi:hypothetical protein
VISAKVTNASPRNLKLEAAVEKEVNTWIFPKCNKEKTDTKVSCDFTY